MTTILITTILIITLITRRSTRRSTTRSATSLVVAVVVTIIIIIIVVVAVLAYRKLMLLYALLSNQLLENVSVYTIEAATRVQNAEVKAYASTTNLSLFAKIVEVKAYASTRE
jgi:hypothetical protein